MNTLFSEQSEVSPHIWIGSGTSSSRRFHRSAGLCNSEHFVCAQIEGADFTHEFETIKRLNDVKRLLIMVKANAKYWIFRE